MNNELVTIGVMSYNRPELLRLTLVGITKQTYQNLEIIITDNCSPNPNVDLVIKEFAERDSRIQYYRQEKNYGAGFSSPFVLKKASGNYFMWAADDDYFISDNLIEELVKHASNHVLTFSSFICSRDVQLDPSTKQIINAIDAFSHAYENCITKMDYLIAWLNHRAGYPVYGMYNLKLMKEHGLDFLKKNATGFGYEKEHTLDFGYEIDLDYYGEGTILHHLFITGKVKFVPNVYIYMDNNSIKPSSFIMTSCFIEHAERSILIFNNSNLKNDEKSALIKLIKDHCADYLYTFFNSLNAIEQQQIFYKILEKGILKSDHYQFEIN